MATIKKLKTQIENANALGIANLTEKGVEISESATTYEIMQSIAEVKSGGSGGASLNLAYGETAPEDTSKLWIKANEPDKLTFRRDIDGVDGISLSDVYLPTACGGMGCAKVGNRIYLFGGKGNIYLDTISVFDVESRSIETLETTLPYVYCDMGCVSIGTKIYLLGGRKSTTTSGFLYDINVFDTETETITTLSAHLSTGCASMGCANIDTKIYLFGGYKSSTNFNTIYVFDSQTETITKLSATLPTACYGMGCVTIGTKIYLFGGYTGSNKLNTINVFDTETETVTTLSVTLPTICYDTGCAGIGTKVYLFGGCGSNSTYLSTINVFDVETETVTTLTSALPTACYGMGCAGIGTEVYLFGGNGSSYLNTINVFTLTHQLSQGNIELQTSFLNNVFKLINTDVADVEVGVENVYIGNENNEAEVAQAYLYNGTDWQQI